MVVAFLSWGVRAVDCGDQTEYPCEPDRAMTETPRAPGRDTRVARDDTETRVAVRRSSSSASRARSSSARSSPSASRSSRRRSALADALHPGAERLILFHIVARGSCWVAVDDGVRHWAEAGRRDRAALRRPPRHRRRSRRRSACRSSRCSTRCRGTTMPTHPPRRRRATASTSCAATCTPRTRCSIPRCGCSRRRSWCASPTARPRAGCRRASPTRSRRRAADERERRARIATRLPELVLIEVLRVHLATAPAADHGWIAALHDPVLAPALALLHAAPGPHVDGRRARRGRGGARARCSTSASARCSGAHRSATSPSGACTWPRTCSPHRHRRCGGRPPGRLRLRGGVQPRVQARARCCRRATGASAARVTPVRDPVNREIIGRRRLRAAGCVAADEEAARMLATAPDDDTLDAWLRRRADGEPLAWITGWSTFCGARVRVAPGVYVPRPQTEELARRRRGRAPRSGFAPSTSAPGAGAVAAHLRRAVPDATGRSASTSIRRAARCARRQRRHRGGR